MLVSYVNSYLVFSFLLISIKTKQVHYVMIVSKLIHIHSQNSSQANLLTLDPTSFAELIHTACKISIKNYL